ncbi:putative cytochrome P450, EF-hand domain, EF-hand domain pair, EF-Hand 1, calcium-binding protein [Helianthus annuus]|nr:putative cytochrome P450, EF-hand domain, EF-hand domain pair, EF-Hand 1, calcium-binding protein [Helianthus annuus]
MNNFKKVALRVIAGCLSEQADADGNGTIDYEEFITATMHMNRMDREDHLRTILTPHNTPDHLLCAAASPRRTTSYAGRPGTDTTTATLTWALALLVNHHVVLKIAQQELENHDGRDRKVEESDMNNLVYLQAIIKETMHDASLSSCTTFCST